MARSGLEEAIEKDYKERGLDVTYEETILKTLVPWNYKPDYFLRTKSGKYIVIEAKGDLRYFTTEYRKKWLAMYRQYSGKYDIRIIFQHDKKLPHSKHMTTVGWAEKHGITYHVGEEIPESWSNE